MNSRILALQSLEANDCLIAAPLRSLVMKKILLMATGGTIASLTDESGLASESLTGEEMVRALSSTKSVATVTAAQFSNVSSDSLDFKIMHELSKRIDQVISSNPPDGIVVTMGTNAMEECAYFLDLVLRTHIPIIVTGAMRNPSLLSSDADINLHNAIVAASSDALRSMGVIIAMNGEMHHPLYAMKAHTTAVTAFRSPNHGPMGVIRGDRVVLYGQVPPREHLKPSDVTAQVDLIKYCMGMDGSLLDAAVRLGADGIVIEAFGGGNVTPASIPAIRKAIDGGIPVVMVSRCISGELLEDTYTGEGSETHLKQLGVIFASGVSGVKARVKLVLALSSGLSTPEIRRLFEK